MDIDLGAEQLIAAEKHGEKIAVEIKSFVAVSVLYEFHLPIGQYRNYELALLQEDPERVLDLVQPVGITQRVPRIAVRRISRAVLFSCMSIESVLDADSGHQNSA
jgi:XisH protein